MLIVDFRLFRVLTLLCLLWLLTGCSPRDDDALHGRMLLWHTGDEADIALLQDELIRFAQIHPDVTIRTQAFSGADELYSAFLRASDAGLGPDLLLAPHEWIRPFADQGLIRPIEQAIDNGDRDRYMPTALTALTYQDHLYGLPQSVNTSILYYKNAHIQAPPTTLAEMLNAADQGHAVAFSSNFPDAGWGIQAFGGRIFNDAYAVIVDRGGFTNWLAWLNNASERPGIILDTNRDLLRRRFIDDASISYFVGDFDDLAVLRQALGADSIGLALLPGGPNGNAGPFLHVRGMLFSSASSPNQQHLALTFALFITNAEQSSNLMRQAQQVPANLNVRINPRLEPDLHMMANQARAAVAIPNQAGSAEILTLINDAFVKVLEGVIEAPEAAAEVSDRLQSELGIEMPTISSSVCDDFGTIRLLSLWSGPESDALETVLLRYAQQCPAVEVEVIPISTAELLDIAAENRLESVPYDLILGSQELLHRMARAEQVQPLDTLVDPELLQRFWPQVLNAMRVDDTLFGLPVLLDLDALYFNRDLVGQPALTLADFAHEAEQGKPIVFVAGFAANFWQINAFGGQFVDADGVLHIGDPGWRDGLQWLATAVEAGTIELVNDEAEALQRFLDRESAYLVGGPELMPRLLAEMGEETIGVATLPAGPVDNASPLLHADGFMLVPAPSTTRATRAMRFVTFVTNPANQRWLATISSRVPANAATELTDISSVTPFVEQVAQVTVRPNLENGDELLAALEEAYHAVLFGNVSPADALMSARRTLESDLIPNSDQGENDDEP